MKIKLTLILFFTHTFILSATTPKVSLEKAIADGLRLSYEYQNHFLDRESAELKRLQTAKKKLFNVDFTANYLFKSDTMIIETPAVQLPNSLILPGNRIEAGLKHNYDFKLSLLQPLFTGGILTYSEKMSEIQKAVEAHSTELKKHEIAGAIKISFFDYLLLIQKKNSLLALQKQLALHQSKLENLFTEGLVKKSDVLETLSKNEEMNLAVKDTDLAIKNERARFHQLCGHYPENIDEHYREETLTAAEALDFFKNHHPVLKQLDSQKDILMYQKKIALSRYFPQMNGFAELHYGRPGIDFFEKKWSLYFQGGIMLQVPLFDWKKGKSDRELIDIQARKLENQKKSFIREIDLQLEHLYAAIRTMDSKLVHVKRLIQYAREDTELKSLLYEEKQITNIDYLTALLKLEEYSISRDKIIFQIEKIKANINTLTGNIREKS